MLVAVFIGSVLLSVLLIGVLRQYLIKQSHLDQPNHRSLHRSPIPKGAGAIIIGLSTLALCLFSWESERISLLFIAILTVLWSWLGWVDDKLDLPAKWRFLIQIILVCVSLVLFGYPEYLQIQANVFIFVGFFGAILSVLAIVWFINLYNFMDGMDGMAAMQTIIATTTLSFWLWCYQDYTLSAVCLVMSGATLGFLYWNWHPAKIFLGDVGSIAIAAFLSMITLIAIVRYEIPVLSFVLLFAVFIFDATLTLFKRCVRKEKIWQAHNKHYYQLLARVGYRHTYIVSLSSMLMLLNAVLASFFLLKIDLISYAVSAEILLLCVYLFYVHYRLKNKPN